MLSKKYYDIELMEFKRNGEMEQNINKIIDDNGYYIIIYSSDKYDIGVATNNYDSIIYFFTDKNNTMYVITGLSQLKPFIISPNYNYFSDDLLDYDYITELQNSTVTTIYASLWLWYVKIYTIGVNK
jgi:hypothetical protein